MRYVPNLVNEYYTYRGGYRSKLWEVYFYDLYWSWRDMFDLCLDNLLALKLPSDTKLCSFKIKNTYFNI